MLSTALNPRIIAEESTTKVACPLEKTVVLRCYAKSKQKVFYSWSKEGESIDKEYIQKLDDFLIVRPQSQQDFGLYTCHVTNSYGSAVQGILLEEYKTCNSVKEKGKKM